jgi:hypothetical protein
MVGAVYGPGKGYVMRDRLNQDGFDHHDVASWLFNILLSFGRQAAGAAGKFVSHRWDSAGDQVNQKGPVAFVKQCYVMLTLLRQPASRLDVAGGDALEALNKLTLPKLRSWLTDRLEAVSGKLGDKEWVQAKADVALGCVDSGRQTVDELLLNLGRDAQHTFSALSTQFSEAWNGTAPKRETAMDMLRDGAEQAADKADDIRSQFPRWFNEAVTNGPAKAHAALESVLANPTVTTTGKAALTGGALSLVAAALFFLRQKTQNYPGASGTDPNAQAAYRGYVDGTNAAQTAAEQRAYWTNFQTAASAPPILRRS